MQGQGYKQIAQIIQSNTEANYKQALRIARTEGGRLRSAARQKANEEMKELGVDIRKQWLATADRKTRHKHQRLDGQIKDIEDYFEVDGYKAKAPRMFGVAALDIHCRCTTISIVDGISADLRLDNETGEEIPFQKYSDWRKSIDERYFTISSSDDFMKAKNMREYQVSKEKEFIQDLNVSFGARKVLNSKFNMYVSNTLPGTKKSINYYEKQIDQALSMLNIPDGAELPRIVLMNSEKDMGVGTRFGSFSSASNTVYLDARKPNEKSILSRLKKANQEKRKQGYKTDWFAVDDDALSPVIHELGHYQHYQYVNKYAKENGLMFGESKRRFNEKLIEFMGQKRYNVSEDISAYAKYHFAKVGGELSMNSTNEIISESYTLAVLEKSRKATQIINFLERGEW